MKNSLRHNGGLTLFAFRIIRLRKAYFTRISVVFQTIELSQLQMLFDVSIVDI